MRRRHQCTSGRQGTVAVFLNRFNRAGMYVLSGRNAGVYLFSSGVLGSIVEPGTLGVFRDPLTLRCYAHVRQRGVLSSPQANLQCCAHVLCLFVFPAPFVELHQ